jgi:hypothetical protein
MPISWNEIKGRALAFSREWATESSEDAEAKSFWDGFFYVFGISRKRVASFEEPAKKLGDRRGYIDLFWKGTLLVEHKSRGKNLDRAYAQALDYFPGIAERDLPKYILVSDFARFRLYDLEAGEQFEFALEDLYKECKLFGFIAGYQRHRIREQDPVNLQAAEAMGLLHDQMKEVGYDGHPLELYLVRLLFCLFAEDTGIFERQQFQEFIEQRTSEDGSDLAAQLSGLFQVLNTAPNRRLKNLDEQLMAFPYVNGLLFAETLPHASFDSRMRQGLLHCTGLDWGRISPAIFGSLFQSIMDRTARRNLGAHYTSEINILKLIKPLFLDDLWEEFERIKGQPKSLGEFQTRLRQLTFLDPACGCGNFLVIAYRELRLLELAILKQLSRSGQLLLDIGQLLQLNVDQFYGIEVEEFPSQIAQVALWLMDHQMNLLISEEFGLYFARIPLQASSTIVHANALDLDWATLLKARCFSYVMGNPPFVGAKFLSAAQKADVAMVFAGIKNAGLLDFVAAWYVKAARLIAGTDSRCAFVSTNSICQGEQVGVLWSWMRQQGMQTFFAHRTFSWNNEGRAKAAVHCVIVGFAAEEISPKWLFSYDDINGEPQRSEAKMINPYLVDGPDLTLPNRSKPLCAVPCIGIGNKPIDGGHYLFTEQERDAFLALEAQAAPYFHRWIGADEFLNGYERWCLWLGDCSPAQRQAMPEAIKRVKAVQKMRLASKSAPTQKLASIPTRFHVENFPPGPFLVIPEVSSERRLYLPIGFEEPPTLCSNLVKILPDATLYHFGILSSLMHNAWMRTVCGRLKSDYRYSVGIVYNNFPWPLDPDHKQRQAVEAAARAVLDARAGFPDSNLAQLYDPLTMPPDLSKAHQRLDQAVDKSYGNLKFESEGARMSYLFQCYQKATASILLGRIRA